MTPLPDLSKKSFSHDDLVRILSATEAEEIEEIRAAAEKTLLDFCSNEVYFRGLIEVSNICANDCLYCSIRKSNQITSRYELSLEDILSVANWCCENHFGSIVLQGGERRDPRFIDFIEKAVKSIKIKSQSYALPNGLGITLSLGEQSEETYRRWHQAGAHRYLLRVETTSPKLFARLHPDNQKFETRCMALSALRRIGYQVGTGVMIGFPGQTFDDLANDILFYKMMDIDMISMGPYIPNPLTPMGNEPCLDETRRVQIALLMVAATRLILRDTNIAASTSLNALDPLGREQALRFGANVMIPLMLPPSFRNETVSPFSRATRVNEMSPVFVEHLEDDIRNAHRELGRDCWGDSLHALKRALG